jgi:glycosyltransferase involved in cell wall biosynthesis
MGDTLLSTAETRIPKVSIIVTVYNNEQYLRKCLDSIVTQTLHDIEIILVNDGSIDGSLDILNKYAESDGRIVVIDKPNAGLGHTFNTGLDRATGKYIGYVETDDWIDADMFENLYALAEEHDADVVRSNPYLYAGNTDTSTPVDELPAADIGIIIQPRNNASLPNIAWRIWSCLYRREFMLAHNIRMNETPGAQFQDVAICLEVLVAADRMYLTQQHYYHYRIDNPNSSLNHEKYGWQWTLNELRYFDHWIEAEYGENAGDAIKPFQATVFRLYRSSLLSTPDRANKRKTISVMQERFRLARMSGFLDRSYFTADAWRYLNLLLRSKLLFSISMGLLPALMRIASLNTKDADLRPQWENTSSND